MTPELWAAIITAVVPVLILVTKTLIPKIPKFLLPILAPILGAGMDIALHFAGASTAGVIMGAVMGGLGTWLRETVDQLKKAA